MTGLIKAVTKDEFLIKEADSLLQDKKQLHLWWLGQSGYLVQWNGYRLLIDPYLSDSLTKKYENTDKPHIRMSERVIAPQLLTHISFITSSHNHTDHLDAETLIPVLKNNPFAKLIIPEANRSFVANRLQCEESFSTGLNDGESVSFGDITFYGVPAKHNEIERNEKGQCVYMGYVIKIGPYTIYHSGDTLWFDELVPLLRPFHVDVAILPVNGNKPERRVAGNLNSSEAVKLAKEINAARVTPCHYDMFTFNTADVNEFIQEAITAAQAYHVLQPGERLSINL